MKKIVFFILMMICLQSIHAQTDSTFKVYTGKYLFPEGSIVADVTVVLEGDNLSMISSAGTSSLTKLGVDSFSIVEFSGLAVFKRSEDKTIKGVYIDAGGYVMDGVKEEVKEEVKKIASLPFIKLALVFNNKRELNY